MNNIAIIVTTMLRDNLLEQAILSMRKNLPEGAVILIGDQGIKNGYVDVNKINKYENLGCYYYLLPFDCGLSYARNYLVEMAAQKGCEYCVMASDSMIFNKSTKDIGFLTQFMQTYDCIGCDLTGINIYWVGWLSLIPGKCFSLDFIDRSKVCTAVHGIFDCNITHNFFIAKTESLRKVKWDETLKLAEHEDFFYRYAQAGYKVGFTHRISCDRIKTRDGAHGAYRLQNWNNGLKTLYKKYDITGWISYVNRERGFYGIPGRDLTRA